LTSVNTSWLDAPGMVTSGGIRSISFPIGIKSIARPTVAGPIRQAFAQHPAMAIRIPSRPRPSITFPSCLEVRIFLPVCYRARAVARLSPVLLCSGGKGLSNFAIAFCRLL
jgi:hypothetical protein